MKDNLTWFIVAYIFSTLTALLSLFHARESWRMTKFRTTCGHLFLFSFSVLLPLFVSSVSSIFGEIDNSNFTRQATESGHISERQLIGKGIVLSKPVPLTHGISTARVNVGTDSFPTIFERAVHRGDHVTIYRVVMGPDGSTTYLGTKERVLAKK